MPVDSNRHVRCHIDPPLVPTMRAAPASRVYPPAGGANTASTSRPPSPGSGSSGSLLVQGRERNVDGTSRELTLPEPQIVQRPSPSKSRRLEFEDIAFYKAFYSPIELMEPLRKCLVHDLTEEQLDSFIIRNDELKKYINASNLLTKKVAVRRFLKTYLGDEYIHFPLCANLCGFVPNIIDVCGHARCNHCQPPDEGCIICGRQSQVNVAVDLNPPNVKPTPVPKLIRMGLDSWLETNTYLLCEREEDAALLYRRAPEFFTFTRSNSMLKKNNVFETMADKDEQCSRMLSTDVVEQRHGYHCIVCRRNPRVFLFGCKHLYYCLPCIERNGSKCPGCQTAMSGVMPLKHDLIYLEK